MKAYIGLGSNLQSPKNQIKKAFEALAKLPKSVLLKTSNLYLNPPVGMLDQPDFINAVAVLETSLSAQTLLENLLAIEQVHQRIRTQKDGPRTLDLDLLLYGNETIQLENFQVPHPRMKERSFVMLPLFEIEPELMLPCGTSARELANHYSKFEFEVLRQADE